MPKTGHEFGQLVGGQLVLRGVLFEILNPLERWFTLAYWIDYHFGRIGSELLYFLPLEEVAPENRLSRNFRNFLGLFIQEREGSSTNRTFYRVGCVWHSGRAEDRLSQFLDTDQWERLQNFHTSVEEKELITLV